MELNLERPLLFFDIESTGLNIPCDSIIELSFVKVFPGGEQRIKTWKIKPWDYLNKRQRPIDPAASKVNGVTDDMLVNCPTFLEVAPEVVEWMKDSDLAGFNSVKFDLPMLAEELERVKSYCLLRIASDDASDEQKEKARETLAAVEINLHEPKMVDVQNIFHAMEPRNLRAAYRFYCGGEDFDNAHTAEADTVATYEVLKGQLDRYPNELKNDVESLASFVGKKYVDFAGQLIYDDNKEVVVNFGKHKGKLLREVYKEDPSYFSWVQNGNFTLDTKRQFARLKEEFRLEELAEKKSTIGATTKR